MALLAGSSALYASQVAQPVRPPICILAGASTSVTCLKGWWKLAIGLWEGQLEAEIQAGWPSC